MTRPMRWLAVICFGFALPCFAGEAQWIEIRSPHFTVVTDAGDRRGRDVAVRFEQMRGVFGSLMTKAKVNTPIPLQIIGFRSSKELRQFAPLFQGKAVELSGLFLGAADRCFILLDLSSENPWQVVFHEYAHQLMNGTLSMQLDPWFEEGFAEYFRSITVDGKEADVGRIPDDEYNVLDNSGWMKISDLLRVEGSSKTYNESGDRRTVFYAESGLLVHYLYDNSLIVKLPNYFDLVRNKHLSVEEAIQQAFGMSAAQFDKTLRSYESSRRYGYYKVPAPAGIAAKAYMSAPLSAPDALAILAEVHLHSPDYREKAEEEFNAALKMDPNNAIALRGLGYSYLIKRDFEKAAECFHKSAALNPDDPKVLYYSALLSQHEAAVPPAENDERLHSMQRELERSIKLDPDFADAYNILAFTYSGERKPGEAIVVLRKAIELNPRNVEYRINLANLYLANGQLGEATAILHRMENSNDPAVATRVAAELAQVERYRELSRPTTQASTQSVASDSVETKTPGSAPQPASPKFEAAKFLHGKLLSVDCSSPPAAILMVLAGTKTWKMRIADSNNAIVIGADRISCDWINQKVAVNYNETADGWGDVISLEIQ